MTSPVDDTRIISPFMPSLFHLALMKTAVQLYNSFDTSMLDKVYDFIQHQNDGESEVCVNDTFNRAKSSFLLIPPRLRKKVMEAVNSMKYAALRWEFNHLLPFELYHKENFQFFWRSDGSMDEVKTAHHTISNESIDIKKRFLIACEYCLEEGIKSLWLKIENLGLSDTFKCSVERFWIERVQKKEVQNQHTHWTVAFPEFLIGNVNVKTLMFPRLSTFFHLMPSEKRRKCLIFLRYVKDDDLRFCLLTLNKEVEEEVVKDNVYRILYLFLIWPLQVYFIKMVEKLWKFMDYDCYDKLLCDLFALIQFKKDFNYRELLELFLTKSPNHLKETLFKSPRWQQRVNSFLDETRKKRKNEGNEQTPCKRR